MSFESYGTDFLVGNPSVCTQGNNTVTYSVNIEALPVHTGSCEYLYTWSVVGGSFPNGSTNATAVGSEFQSVEVDWDEGRTEYRISVSVSNNSCGNLNVSDFLLISENNENCGDGGDSDGQPTISGMTFQKFDGSEAPIDIGPFCSGSYRLFFTAQNTMLGGDYEKSISIKIDGELEYKPLAKLRQVEGSFYDFYINFDTLSLIEPTKVNFRCSMSGGDLDNSISKTFTFIVTPTVDVDFVELMPPIHSNSGDAQVIFANTNDQISHLKINAFLKDSCDEENKSRVEVYIDKDSIETINVCTSRDSDFGIGVKYLEKEDDRVILVDDSIGISNGIYLMQVEAAQAVADSFEVDSGFCPQFYYFKVPEPTIIDTFSISVENPKCFGESAVITGSTNYDRVYYSNNPNIFYELYDENDNNVIDTITVSPGQEFSMEVSPNYGDGNYYVKATKIGCENLSGEDAFGYQVQSNNNVNLSFKNEIEIADFTSVNESCYNENDGSISFKITGGTPPYKLDIINNSLIGIRLNDINNDIESIAKSETIIIDSLAPDNDNDKEISFVIIDINGCKSDTIDISKRINSVQNQIGVSKQEVTNFPKCLLGEDGAVKIVPNGGNGKPYTLSVKSITKDDGTDYSDYTVTANSDSSEISIGYIPANCSIEYSVFDKNGCESTELFVLDVGDNTSALNFQNFNGGTDPDCFDGLGSVYLELYNIENNPGSIIKKLINSDDESEVDSVETNHTDSTINFTGLGEGNYFIRVEDTISNCTIPISYLTFSINIPDQPTFTSTSPFQIPCKGDSRNINLSIINDKGSFSDFNLQLERKASSESEFTSANMDTVSISENAIGGLIIENLYEGKYKISGTDGVNPDGLGCSFAEYEFELVEPEIALTINAYPDTLFTNNAGEVYHISEYGANDGEISFQAEGGEGSYNFTLFVNEDDSMTIINGISGTFSNLFAKDDDGYPIEYFVSVEDERNCIEYSDTFTLVEPDSLIFTYELNNYISSENDSFNIKCYNGTDNLKVETEGGVYPHLVEILKGGNTEESDTLYSQNDSAVFRDLSHGRYKIKVTDKFDTNISSGYRKIIDIDSIDFVQPDSLNVVTSMTQPICYGDSTGSITITPSGGVPFANGEYDIHIFDQEGDSILNDITDELSIVADSGIYYYTIFDAFNCEYESEDEYYTNLGNKIIVTELSPRLSVVEDTITYPPCAGDETATLSVSASGGRSDDGSYILKLYDNNDPPLYGTNDPIYSVISDNSGDFEFENLFAGDYTVTVYDDELCSEMIAITIDERDDPLEFNSIEPVLSKCPNSSDAKLKIISIGGDSPHSFSLNNTDFSPSDSITYSNDSSTTYYHKTFTGLIGDSTYNIYLKDDNYYDGSINNVCLIDTSQTIPKTPSLALDFKKTDIKCFGEQNGEFTLSPSYGDQNNINDFTIEINGPNGVVSHDQGYVNNLSPGRYEIEITLADTSACQTPLFDKIDIDQPEPLIVDIFSTTKYNCSTIEDIIINGEISGGLSTANKFLYAINSDNKADFDSLKTSNSAFKIKKKLEPGWNVFYLKSSPYNCMVSDSFFVESEQPHLQILTNQAVSCLGKSDGEIKVTSNFEKLNFKLINDEDTFSIDDSDADTVVFEGLEAGIYQLTGSNSSCLADTLEVIVNQPDSIIIQPEIIDMPSCNQANGLGSVNILGGSSPYQVYWQLGNGNILDSSSLKSGYYDVIVEDANNCSAIFKDFLVEELNDFTVSVQSSSNPTCGKDNGSILIQPNEGIPPYEIIWFKDGSILLHDTDSLTGLSEGSYIFSVTDAMGCIFADSVELTGTAPMNVNISEEDPANCDTQNGSVTLSVTGGTSPYTYVWPDSIPNTEGNYAEGLWGGEIYTVSVIDANLCSKDYKFSIGNNGAPEVAVHTIRPKCGLANGSIEIELLSENDASYEWKEFENTNSTLDSIPSGIYFVTVTANDCPITKRIELTEDINNPLSVNPININASCNDIGGEIDLNISGGIPPYAITWDDTPLNDSIRTGLSSGNYSFVVTDNIGCTASGDIYLGKEELPQLSLNSIGNAACGETNGYIQLDSLSSDYTFNWSHNELLDHHLAENLSSGLYSVYAVNATGCSTDTVSYYISSSNTDLKIQEVAVISASCNESADGSLEVNAVNGVPPYQYEWDDEDQQTGNIAQGLRPGTYTVRVTDATNCSRVKSLTLGQVNPVYISNISKNAPSCHDAMDGSIAITASGGKGNYSYEWSTGDTTSTISGLGSGEYLVTIYDNFVCSDQASITITAPDTLSAEYLTEKPNCYATSDGQVTLSISGGIPPYTVEWEDGSTLKRRFDLASGNYEVFISDNNNCSLIKNINVPAKDSVSLDYEITSVSCNGGNDGSIRIKSISNANSPKVEWSNGQIGNTLRNVSAGFYEANVTDSYGCVTSFEFQVGSPDPLQVVNETITDVLCKNGFNGSIAFDVIGGNGNYKFNWDDGPRTKNRFNLTAGNYKVTVSDDLNCTIERQFSISEPDLLVLDYTTSSVSCFGNADGFASIEIEGGVSPYQISWSDGSSDSIRNDLAAGIHDVLVTDANNCSESIEVIIPNLNPIRINEVIQTIPSCYQGSDGELELDISGGVAPYSVSWSNGKTGASIDSISAGIYKVTITDDNNCQLTELISLGDGTPIYLTSLVTANPICYGEPSGMVEVVPNGGNSPFEVVWADGTTATRRDDLLAGSHTFDVVDATGCSVSYEINLQDPPLEEIEGLPSEVFLCTGGVANLDAGEWNSYNWTADNGFTSNEREVSIEAEGNYNLAVTNQEGCEDNHQFTVTKDDNILTADFLLTTEAVVQDTVIIVDVSWRVPDSVRWINPDDPDFYLVSQTEEYQEVIFTRTGEFELNMKAKLDFCEADVSKTITVLSREEAARLSDEANKNISNDLHISTSIYPNPNFGDFRIEMKGNKEYDHNSKIIDVNTGIEYYRFSGKKQMNYVLKVGDNRLPDGVYLLMIETEEKTITKRFIVK